MLPNFICVGAQKAGTTWLDKMLREHPDVWLPPKKEIHYFDGAYFEKHRGWDVKATRRVLGEKIKEEMRKQLPDFGKINYYSELVSSQDYSFEWYKRWFQHGSSGAETFKVLGDITPEYCMIPQEGIDRLLSEIPGVKIIYLIRDPLDRAWSQVKMRIKRRGMDTSNVDWQKLLSHPDIISRGDYQTYVPRWFHSVPSEQMLFLPFGSIKTSPETIMSQVEQFLNLEPHQYTGLNKVVHKNNIKVDKPDELSKLQEKLQPQYDFLAGFFSKEFFSQVK